MSDFAQKTQDCIIKELRNQVKQLKQENSDLKNIKIATLKASLDEKNEIICDLREENEKLKKAIEIIKNYMCEELFSEDKRLYIDTFLDKENNQQEYDLLKEVLGE